jgi:hypothetical protein
MRGNSLILLGCLACAGGDDGSTAGVDSGDTSDVDTEPPADTGPQLPKSPAPFTVDVSGGWTGSVTFDRPTCVNYPQGSLVNFRQFWRGNHNGLLIIEVLSNFEGAGAYNTTDHNLRIALQSEAGSEYTLALRVDTTAGDSATLQVDHISDVAWGEATLTGMHGSADGAEVGAVALTGPLPVYCPVVTSQ